VRDAERITTGLAAATEGPKALRRQRMMAIEDGGEPVEKFMISPAV